jgi:putative phosphoesterase
MTRIGMRIGLISDTHGLLRDGVAALFHGVDLIVHAGDVGGAAVIDALSKMAPLEAVYGNVDDPHDPRLARELTLPVGALTLHVSHGHELGSPTPALLIAKYHADILVFGHTHRALVTSVERSGATRLIVNPGAAGPKRFNVQPSVAILTVSGRQADAQVITL